jgi:hypothetical protein
METEKHMPGSLVLVRESWDIHRSEWLMVVFETDKAKAIAIAEKAAREDSAKRVPSRPGSSISGNFVYGASPDIVERHVRHGLTAGSAIGWRDK